MSQNMRGLILDIRTTKNVPAHKRHSRLIFKVKNHFMLRLKYLYISEDFPVPVQVHN